jgi:hypothetical protein
VAKPWHWPSVRTDSVCALDAAVSFAGDRAPAGYRHSIIMTVLGFTSSPCVAFGTRPLQENVPHDLDVDQYDAAAVEAGYLALDYFAVQPLRADA